MKLSIRANGKLASAYLTYSILTIFVLSLIGFTTVVAGVYDMPGMIYAEKNYYIFSLSKLAYWFLTLMGGFTYLGMIVFFALSQYSCHKEK